ncbi:hypothetical protein HYT57_00920 [Candidatus Woesearchaeota archaeon]|nr:hypothetical protein [Candidatus Woesearchaeota archaeon]
MSQDYIKLEGLPKGSYGIQIGQFDFKRMQIVWGGAQWDLATTELAATKVAERWRKESIDSVLQKEGSRIDVDDRGLAINPERKAFFYRAIKLGGN